MFIVMLYVVRSRIGTADYDYCIFLTMLSEIDVHAQIATWFG